MENGVVVLVRQEGLGTVAPEDRSFGIEMFDRLLHSIESQPDKPEAICFYTEGVRLCCEGSILIPSLKLIEAMGVPLVLCKTCLEKYGLLDKVAVGHVGTMKEIASLLLGAHHVVTV